jgi:hypothetical protein
MSPPLRLTAEARLPCRFAPTSEVSQLSTHRVLFDAASREVLSSLRCLQHWEAPVPGLHPPETYALRVSPLSAS